MKKYYYLIKSSKYETMFYVHTAKGVSQDFYNLPRAKQHLRNLYYRDTRKEDVGDKLEWPVMTF